MKSFIVVAAADAETRGIGYQGSIPWSSPLDLKTFMYMTSVKPLVIGNEVNTVRNVIVMGYNTWQSLPRKPLRNRLNVVITKEHFDQVELSEDVVCFPSLQLALENLSDDKNIHNIFVIGGGKIYEQAIQMPECKRVIITRFFGAIHQYDTFMPKFEHLFEIESSSFATEEDRNQALRFETWTRK